MPPSIALSMIVRDVDKIIGPCMETVAPYVDELVIADTGSSDKTKQAIYKVAPGAKIVDYTAEEFPQSFLKDAPESFDFDADGSWTGRSFLTDFAAARQYSLAHCTSDYVIWLDSDDVLIDGENLRRLVEEMHAGGRQTAMLLYRYAWWAGKSTGVMRRDRIWKRDERVRWVCPIHEILMPSLARWDSDVCSVNQAFGNHPSKAGVKVHRRNLKVLRHWFAGKKTNLQADDARLLYYLADEESDIFPDEALHHFKLCQSLSRWDAELAKAHLGAGYIHEARSKAAIAAGSDAMNEHSFMAVIEYGKAMASAAFDPDGFFAAARLAQGMGLHRKCVELTERGATIAAQQDGRDILPHDVTLRGWRAMNPYARSLRALGNYKKALDVVKTGLAQAGGQDPDLLEIKTSCERALGS